MFTEKKLLLQYAFRDEILENRVARAMNIVKTVRSFRSDYGLTAKIKTERESHLDEWTFLCSDEYFQF